MIQLAAPISSQAIPALSINTSAAATQDFIALLASLIGPAASMPQQAPLPNTAPSLNPTASPDVPAANPQDPSALLAALLGSGALGTQVTGLPLAATQPEPQNPTQEPKPAEPPAATASATAATPAPESNPGLLFQVLCFNMPPSVQTASTQLPAGSQPPGTAAINIAGPSQVSIAGGTNKSDGPKQCEDSKLIELQQELIAQAVAAGSAAKPAQEVPATSAVTGKEPSVPAPLAEITPRAILDDLKKFEITIQHERLKPAELQPLELAEQALVTTNPLANIQQPQLTPRMMALLQRVTLDTKPEERSKSQTAPADSEPSVPATSASPTPAADSTRTFDAIEQPRPAHQIEIPNMPKLQVVRTVSMEVGDSESQVMVRIEDRNSGMTLHLGAGNEMLHHSIESSVGSLEHALKQEQIQISNIEVSRKASIDKIRRMKEAH